MQVEHETQYNAERERNQASMTCRKWIVIGNSHRHTCWKSRSHPGAHECSCWQEWFDKGKA